MLSICDAPSKGTAGKLCRRPAFSASPGRAPIARVMLRAFRNVSTSVCGSRIRSATGALSLPTAKRHLEHVDTCRIQHSVQELLVCRGCTPLHVAAHYGRDSSVELLKHKADVEAKNTEGRGHRGRCWPTGGFRESIGVRCWGESLSAQKSSCSTLVA